MHLSLLLSIPPKQRSKMQDRIQTLVIAKQSKILIERCLTQESLISFRIGQLKFAKVMVVSPRTVLLLKGISKEKKDLEVGKIESRDPKREREFLEVDLAIATLVEVATKLGMSKSSTATKGRGLGKSRRVSLEELMILIPGGLIASCLNLKMIRISLFETKCLLVV